MLKAVPLLQKLTLRALAVMGVDANVEDPGPGSGHERYPSRFS